VRSLTKTDKDSYIDNLKFESQYPGFMIVKAADRLDNLRSPPEDEGFRTKQLKETKEHYIPLFQLCTTLVHDATLRPFNRIFAEIKGIAL
jgi:(p)ppGpp synthase/HD superfamily hydrolase